MYLRINDSIHPAFAGLGETVCEPAAHALEKLAGSLKSFKKEADKTYREGNLLKLRGALVVADAEDLANQLPDFVSRRCCDAEMRNLEAQVRALPWVFQKAHGTKVVRVEVFRDIVAANRNLLAAIQKAKSLASSHSACSPPAGSTP